MNYNGGTHAIETENLSVSIGGRKILRDINIEIPRGKITAIMGPSGSGKTTLLRVFNRLIEVSDSTDIAVEGKVLVEGRNILEIDLYELRRLFGMVFQEPNPFPHLSIYDNVAIGPKTLRIVRTKGELDELVRASLEMAGLWEEVKGRLKDKPWKLSGGQQQRLCLARALAIKPKILLLDEPTANIDPINTVKIEEALKKLAKEGMTIVMVTHMPQQAIRIASHAIFLYHGSVVEQGPISKLAYAPSSELTKNFIYGEVSHLKA
ncbi:MAG: phosphate ABC transporter ATP-binding protein [Fervidicoccaceae archaeon]